MPRELTSRFRELLETQVGRMRLFKAVQPLASASDSSKMLVALSCNAAAALDEPAGCSDDVVRFMENEEVNYYPGVRLGDPLFGEQPQVSTTCEECRFRFAEIFAGTFGLFLGDRPELT
jgi:hypothetical protein